MPSNLVDRSTPCALNCGDKRDEQSSTDPHRTTRYFICRSLLAVIACQWGVGPVVRSVPGWIDVEGQLPHTQVTEFIRACSPGFVTAVSLLPFEPLLLGNPAVTSA